MFMFSVLPSGDKESSSVYIRVGRSTESGTTNTRRARHEGHCILQ